MSLNGLQSDPTGLETLETFSKAPAINRWLYEKISSYLRGNILEIGSGIGNISSFLLKDQQNVSLSDLRPEYCSILEQKFRSHPHLQNVYELDVSITDFETRFPNLIAQFDTVIALNVIEHIEAERLAIKNAASLLRANGRLVVLVPAGEWLYNRLDKELGHFKRYNKTSLPFLLENAGLKVSHRTYFNGAAIFGWWFSGSVLKNKMIPPYQLKIYNQLVPVFKLADWFINPFAGISVIAVATKN